MKTEMYFQYSLYLVRDAIMEVKVAPATAKHRTVFFIVIVEFPVLKEFFYSLVKEK